MYNLFCVYYMISRNTPKITKIKRLTDIRFKKRLTCRNQTYSLILLLQISSHKKNQIIRIYPNINKKNIIYYLALIEFTKTSNTHSVNNVLLDQYSNTQIQSILDPSFHPFFRINGFVKF